MRDGIKIGTILGITIVLEWSWVFIAVLMSWNLTTVFWGWHPDWGIGNIALAVAGALLFFASLLAHELGHSIVARRYGLNVREIRLFLFGGVSNIEREPPSPRAELLIALVGPLVSVVIGVCCIFVVGLFLPRIDTQDPWATLAALGPISTILFWLGPINVMIGVFNLIPGFPLDGGRVLRAAIWSVTRDLRKATLWASNIGQGIGFCFVLMGIAIFFGARLPLFGHGASGGLWLAFIGWFLSSAAANSYKGLVVEGALEGVQVGDLTRGIFPVLSADMTVADAVAERFMHSSEHAFPVIRGAELVGLLSIGDVRRAPREAWSTTPVAAIMTPRENLVTASPDEDALTALRKLGEADVEQLPVLRDGELVGLLERRAMARWLEMHVGMLRTPTTQRMA